jgi:ribosomal protein S18 acetylase RimI-like enzyme
MNVRDWRTLSSAEAAPLYHSEIARWDAVLHWDTRANWRLVEAARAAGALPGVVARDASGAVQGWAFYLLHRDALQVGALVCRSPAATGAVLGAMLDSREAETASSITLFTFADAPALTGELRHGGFAISHYRYLQRSLARGQVIGDLDRLTKDDVAPGFSPASTPVCPSPAERGWQAGDLVPVAKLLSRAYGAPDASRPFVRTGRSEDWIEYVEQLVTTRGCGVFLPGASVIVESPDGVGAVVLATCLGAGTAHLAQVAVEPIAQGSGRGRRILAAALSNLQRADYVRATLLVSAANGAANGLYDQLGFVETARFIAAFKQLSAVSSPLSAESR